MSSHIQVVGASSRSVLEALEAQPHLQRSCCNGWCYAGVIEVVASLPAGGWLVFFSREYPYSRRRHQFGIRLVSRGPDQPVEHERVFILRRERGNPLLFPAHERRQLPGKPRRVKALASPIFEHLKH